MSIKRFIVPSFALSFLSINERSGIRLHMQRQLPFRSFSSFVYPKMNIPTLYRLLWIQLLSIRYNILVTGEWIGPHISSDPRISVSRDPINRRIQIQTAADPCSSSSDDDFIGGYAIDPCTGRVTNQNYWGVSNTVSSACPTTAPSFSISTTSPTKSPSSPPKSPSSQTDSRSSLKPSLNAKTHPPTTRTGPTNTMAPSVSYKTQLPTVTLGRPAPTLLRPTAAPTPLRPTASSLSSKPTLISRGNNTIIDPIGKNVQNPTDSNNNALALGLGLAAFVALAFLVSRMLWKRKTALRRSKLEEDEEEGDVAVSEPDKGSHVDDCHRTADGVKWFDPSCPLCQETLRRRKAEEELLMAQKRNMSVDVHYCASATCDKCHRSKENEVTFISARSDGAANKTKDVVTCVETMPSPSHLEEETAKRD
jgi:hypothetical protein